MVNNNGAVTWKSLWGTATAATAIVVMVVIAGVGWISDAQEKALRMHAEQPHKSAVHHAEYDRDMNQIESRLTRIEDKLDVLLKRPWRALDS